MAKFKITLRTPIIGSEVTTETEIEDEIVDDCDDAQLDRMLFDIVCESNLFDWDYTRVDES